MANNRLGLGPMLYNGVCKHCGKEFQRKSSNKGKMLFCSRKCAAIVNIPSGSAHPRWKGGVRNRSWPVMRVCAQRVKEAGKCERCGSKDHLQGHHIKSVPTHPELAEDPNNIKVLCHHCHGLEHPKQQNLLARPRKRSGKTIACIVCGKPRYVRISHAAGVRFCNSGCYFVWRKLGVARSIPLP